MGDSRNAADASAPVPAPSIETLTAEVGWLQQFCERLIEKSLGKRKGGAPPESRRVVALPP